MPDSNPPTPPKVLETRTLVRGKKFDYEEVVLDCPGVGRSVRHHIRHPGAVCIVPVLGEGDAQRVVFVRNHRAALGGFLLEIPAGGIEPGEAPEVCAARELIEETGYDAATLVPLGRFYTSPGLSDELMWAYVATHLNQVGQNLDEGEILTVEEVPIGEVLDLMGSGGLTDGKSLLALHLAIRAGAITLGKNTQGMVESRDT